MNGTELEGSKVSARWEIAPKIVYLGQEDGDKLGVQLKLIIK